MSVNALLKKKMVLIAAAVVMWASEAQATAFLALGNNPQPGQENILFLDPTTGLFVEGRTNQTQLLVRFTGDGTEVLSASGGQATIDAVDGFFSFLQVTVPNGSFESLILNPDSTVAGTIDFTVTTNTGVQFFNNIAMTSGGGNFFTFTTDAQQSLLSIAMRADVPLLFEDTSQFRIQGAQLITSVPDGGMTLSLLGGALVGLGMLRRKFNV